MVGVCRTDHFFFFIYISSLSRCRDGQVNQLTVPVVAITWTRVVPTYTLSHTHTHAPKCSCKKFGNFCPARQLREIPGSETEVNTDDGISILRTSYWHKMRFWYIRRNMKEIRFFNRVSHRLSIRVLVGVSCGYLPLTFSLFDAITEHDEQNLEIGTLISSN